jgi:23S rRNA pseudouridine1911/1915/1917 synthase
VGADPQRPGIVHRLDRDVSGLMLVAKTQDAYDALTQQFRDRRIQKTYLALTYGSITEDEGDIKFRIARSTTKPRMAARPEGEEEGRAAWTHYQVQERRRTMTLVELEILSGRTHQIRAHLFAFHHPIIGDALYQPRRVAIRMKAPRLMLQSIKVSFFDPKSGERQTFSIPPVPEFAQLLASAPLT